MWLLIYFATCYSCLPAGRQAKAGIHGSTLRQAQSSPCILSLSKDWFPAGVYPHENGGGDDVLIPRIMYGQALLESIPAKAGTGLTYKKSTLSYL